MIHESSATKVTIQSIAVIMKNWGAYFLVFFTLILAACASDGGDSTFENTASINIVAQDSNYILSLSNFEIAKDQSFQWTIDGEPLRLTKTADSQFKIASSQVKAGKHTITLVQGDKTVSGVLYKIIALSFKVTKKLPHRSDLFTEGFFLDAEDNLWESSGLDAKSKIFKMRWNGSRWQILDSIKESPEEFGEGISMLNGELVHLYWKNQYLKTFNIHPLKNTRSIPFEGEGWGLCSAGSDALWVSNGSSQLRKIQIQNNQLLTLKTINVNNDIGPITNLNELEEMGDKYVWANIWQSDHIVLIDQTNGNVVADLDLSSLGVQERSASYNAEVLNGIAWNKKDNTLWVTGKYWNNIYILQLNNLP